MFQERKEPMNKKCIATCVFLTLFASASGGSLRTWCGPSGEQDWSASTNWVDGLVAMTNDTAYFPQNSAYHSNGTGKRRYWFKVAPPPDFTGVILTTNEFASKDFYSNNEYYNQAFLPTVELEAGSGAAWTVSGDGGVVATAGIEAHIAPSFAGVVDVRKGGVFSAPDDLNSAVRFIGSGTLQLSRGHQFRQVGSFAGNVVLPQDDPVSDADLAALQSSAVRLADGQTLSFDSGEFAMRPVLPIESFADAPGKWTFNGTTYAEGNIPSGPFNPLPPYVLDGELWLTDEPAQIHSAWYTNRMFRITDDWGMSFRYWPELPSGTRITAEKRADGKTRSHCISGNFGILFSGNSPVNTGNYAGSDIQLAENAYGFVIDLYRSDPKPKIMWMAKSVRTKYRSMYEEEIGIKLNAAMDVTVSMMKGIMTVTLEQDGKSASYSHDFTSMQRKFANGVYVGFAAYTSWWGDDKDMAWARNRISNFSGWSRSDADGPGWTEIDNAADFSIYDSEKWSHRKVTRISSTAETTNNAALFVDGGIQMTDSVSNNASVVISKKTFNLSRPMRFKCRFKSSEPYWRSDAHAYISFLFGQNNVSTLGSAAKWAGTYYNNNFGTWSQGIDLVWDPNYGYQTLSYSYHTNTGKRVSLASHSESFGATASTLCAATFPPEKDICADLIWNPSGSFKFIASVGTRDLSKDGRSGYRTWNGLDGYERYAEFTNRSLSVGVTALCRETSYAALTLEELKVMRMNAVAGGKLPMLTVPDNASSSIMAGDAFAGQTLSVIDMERLDLGGDSTLRIMPQSNSTKVGIALLSSAGATLVAEEGAKVSLGGKLAFASDPDETGLVLSGDVSFDGSLSVSIPTSWKAYRCAPIVVVDASETVEGLPSDSTGIPIVDADGAVDSRKYVLSVRDGKLLLDFRKGLSVVVR